MWRPRLVDDVPLRGLGVVGWIFGSRPWCCLLLLICLRTDRVGCLSFTFTFVFSTVKMSSNNIA